MFVIVMKMKKFIFIIWVLIFFISTNSSSGLVNLSDVNHIYMKTQESNLNYQTNLIQLQKIQEKVEQKIWLEQITALVAFCESSNRHTGLWGDEGLAYGKFQFHERTFNWLSDISNIDNLNWKDKYHQRLLFQWAVENSWGHLWTCYRKVIKQNFRQQTRRIL